MKCPYCGFVDTSVIESRPSSDEAGIRRRRECGRCNKRFTTYERVGNIDLKVEKRDGRMEGFEREKVERGLVKACWKRGVAEEVVQAAVDEIEMKLLNRRTTTVKSADIGRMVLSRLKKIDGVAYLRFASVYLDMESLGDFKRIIRELEKGERLKIGAKKNGSVGHNIPAA